MVDHVSRKEARPQLTTPRALPASGVHKGEKKARQKRDEIPEPVRTFNAISELFPRPPLLQVPKTSSGKDASTGAKSQQLSQQLWLSIQREVAALVAKPMLAEAEVTQLMAQQEALFIYAASFGSLGLQQVAQWSDWIAQRLAHHSPALRAQQELVRIRAHSAVAETKDVSKREREAAANGLVSALQALSTLHPAGLESPTQALLLATVGTALVSAGRFDQGTSLLRFAALTSPTKEVLALLLQAQVRMNEAIDFNDATQRRSFPQAALQIAAAGRFVLGVLEANGALKDPEARRALAAAQRALEPPDYAVLGATLVKETQEQLLRLGQERRDFKRELHGRTIASSGTVLGAVDELVHGQNNAVRKRQVHDAAALDPVVHAAALREEKVERGLKCFQLAAWSCRSASSKYELSLLLRDTRAEAKPSSHEYQSWRRALEKFVSEAHKTDSDAVPDVDALAELISSYPPLKIYRRQSDPSPAAFSAQSQAWGPTLFADDKQQLKLVQQRLDQEHRDELEGLGRWVLNTLIDTTAAVLITRGASLVTRGASSLSTGGQAGPISQSIRLLEEEILKRFGSTALKTAQSLSAFGLGLGVHAVAQEGGVQDGSAAMAVFNLVGTGVSLKQWMHTALLKSVVSQVALGMTLSATPRIARALGASEREAALLSDAVAISLPIVLGVRQAKAQRKLTTREAHDLTDTFGVPTKQRQRVSAILADDAWIGQVTGQPADLAKCRRELRANLSRAGVNDEALLERLVAARVVAIAHGRVPLPTGHPLNDAQIEAYYRQLKVRLQDAGYSPGQAETMASADWQQLHSATVAYFHQQLQAGVRPAAQSPKTLQGKEAQAQARAVQQMRAMSFRAVATEENSTTLATPTVVAARELLSYYPYGCVFSAAQFLGLLRNPKEAGRIKALGLAGVAAEQAKERLGFEQGVPLADLAAHMGGAGQKLRRIDAQVEDPQKTIWNTLQKMPDGQGVVVVEKSSSTTAHATVFFFANSADKQHGVASFYDPATGSISRVTAETFRKRQSLIVGVVGPERSIDDIGARATTRGHDRLLVGSLYEDLEKQARANLDSAEKNVLSAFILSPMNPFALVGAFFVLPIVAPDLLVTNLPHVVGAFATYVLGSGLGIVRTFRTDRKAKAAFDDLRSSGREDAAAQFELSFGREGAPLAAPSSLSTAEAQRLGLFIDAIGQISKELEESDALSLTPPQRLNYVYGRLRELVGVIDVRSIEFDQLLVKGFSLLRDPLSTLKERVLAGSDHRPVADEPPQFRLHLERQLKKILSNVLHHEGGTAAAQRLAEWTFFCEEIFPRSLRGVAREWDDFDKRSARQMRVLLSATAARVQHEPNSSRRDRMLKAVTFFEFNLGKSGMKMDKFWRLLGEDNEFFRSALDELYAAVAQPADEVVVQSWRSPKKSMRPEQVLSEANRLFPAASLASPRVESPAPSPLEMDRIDIINGIFSRLTEAYDNSATRDAQSWGRMVQDFKAALKANDIPEQDYIFLRDNHPASFADGLNAFVSPFRPHVQLLNPFPTGT